MLVWPPARLPDGRQAEVPLSRPHPRTPRHGINPLSRIRTIKPEFPQSETIGKLSRDARLLFIQIWTIVDDDGRARAASRMLASLLYPYDDDAPNLIEGWLTELEGVGCIRRYEVESNCYLDIPKWTIHQRVDKPSKSRLPAYFAKPRETSRNLAPDLGPSILDLGPKDAATPPKSFSTKDCRSAELDLLTEAINGKHADLPDGSKADLERQLFKRGKQVLGTNAGGLIKNLLKAKQSVVPLAQAAIETASTKENPREYINAIIRGAEPEKDGFERRSRSM